MTTTSAPVELRALTSLRFFAAFVVFAFHIHIRWPLTSNEFLSSVLSQGAVGMSLFFMLSGFVLAYRYDGAEVDRRAYLIARVAKIYPIYILAALITLPWILGPESADGSPLVAAVQIVLALVACVFLLQAWLPPLFSMWNFSASWSISVEAFLYAVFPALMSRIGRLGIRGTAIGIGVVFALALIPGLVIIAFEPVDSGVSPFYSIPIFRLAEFILGILAFRLSRLVRMRPLVLDVTVGALWVATFVYLGVFGRFAGWYIVHDWIVLPTIFLTLIALSNRTALARALSVEPLPWLGRISYCFYSFQIFVLFVTQDLRAPLIDAIPAFESNALLGVAALVGLLVMSAAGYHFVEEPMRKRVRAALTRRSAPVQR